MTTDNPLRSLLVLTVLCAHPARMSEKRAEAIADQVLETFDLSLKPRPTESPTRQRDPACTCIQHNGQVLVRHSGCPAHGVRHDH